MKKNTANSRNKFENTQESINKLLIWKIFNWEFTQDYDELEEIIDTEKLDNEDIIDEYIINLIDLIKIVSINHWELKIHFEYITMWNTQDEELDEMNISIDDFIKIFIETWFLDNTEDSKVPEKNSIKSWKLKKLLNFHNKLDKKNIKHNKEANKLINKVKDLVKKITKKKKD